MGTYVVYIENNLAIVRRMLHVSPNKKAWFLPFWPFDWLAHTAEQRSLGLQITSKEP